MSTLQSEDYDIFGDLSDNGSEDASLSDTDDDVTGPVAYGFEPIIEYISSSEDDTSSSDSDSSSSDGEYDSDQRLGNTSLCEQCIAMPTHKESRCCQEVDVVTRKIEHCDETDEECETYSCITEVPRFYWICEDIEALEVAMLTMADLRADSFVRPIARR